MSSSNNNNSRKSISGDSFLHSLGSPPSISPTSIQSQAHHLLSQLEKGLNQTSSWLTHVELPTVLTSLLNGMGATDAEVLHFEQHALNTVSSIAAFGNHDLKQLLVTLLSLQIIQPSFMQFMTHVHCLAHHFRDLGEEECSNDALLLTLTPDPKSHLGHLLTIQMDLNISLVRLAMCISSRAVDI